MKPYCVVKLGGSLVGAPRWDHWLDDIAKALAGRGVLVPGGGRWADGVREAQASDGFDDADAHRRALRAMEAHAQQICDALDTCVPAGSPDGIARVLRENKVAVWLPYDMVLADASIPQTWEVTSDSLAAWLARQLGAAWLLLVKSIPHIGAGMDVAELARRGWVDPCFEGFCDGGGFQVRALGRDDRDAFLQCVAGVAGRAGDREPTR